jgi:hypothetical protein
MEIHSLAGRVVEFGVSEPADFFIENGAGPFYGTILEATGDESPSNRRRTCSIRRKEFHSSSPPQGTKEIPLQYGHLEMS